MTGDTGLHAWEVLAEILKSDEAKGIVCDIGMSVTHLSLYVLLAHLSAHTSFAFAHTELHDQPGGSQVGSTLGAPLLSVPEPPPSTDFCGGPRPVT